MKMEKRMFEEQLKAIEAASFTAKNKLIKEYALSRNQVDVTDVITDHYQTIRVLKIGVTAGDKYPSCYYEGLLLTKKGVPFKNKSTGIVFQSNLEYINGTPYTK